MQAYESTAITTVLYPPEVWELFIDDLFPILKDTHLKNLLIHISNLHQNINFTMEGESNVELALLDSLLKQNNGRTSYYYIGSLYMLTNTYTIAVTTKQVAKKVLFPPCLI